MTVLTPVRGPFLHVAGRTKAGHEGRAIFSGDLAYRYLVRREWTPRGVPRRVMPITMCNPSKASHVLDDATLTRCIGFAMAHGYTAIAAINLFAYISTDPRVLQCMGRMQAIGPHNDAVIEMVLSEARRDGEPIVCAWGAVDKMHAPRVSAVWAMLRPGEAQCLAETQGGHPGHPLRLPGTARLRPYLLKGAGQ